MRFQPCDFPFDLIEDIGFRFDGHKQRVQLGVLATNGALERNMLALQFANVCFRLGYVAHDYAAANRLRKFSHEA